MKEHKEHQEQAEPSGSFWLPLFVIVTGAFAAILSSSSVNVAIPKLMAIFGVSSSEVQWVLTGYMLSSAIVIPLSGYLGDRFGNKKVFIYSLAVFTAGSVLCSFAWSNQSLIVFRVLQGLGGGIIMPISMAIIYRIVPLNQIGLALGVWGMSAIMAPAIGPTLGGYILEHFSWRLLFLINIPVGLLGIFLSIFLLKETPIKEQTKFDFWGFLLSTTGCFALLLALSQGSKEGWHSYYIVMLFLISFFSLLLFVLHELSTEEPLLDLRLLKNSTFTLSVLIGGLINIGLFGGVFLTPLFTQNLMGMSAYDTGLLLLPASLVSGFMMPISGALFDRYGAKVISLVGLTVLALGTWELQYITADTGKLELIIILSIRSVGMGLAMMPISTAGMNVVAKHLVGQASSLSNVIRQIFASFGIAILSTIMQNRQIFHGARLSDGISYGSPGVTLGLNQIQSSLISAGMSSDMANSTALSYAWGVVQKQALVFAIDDTFLISAIFIFIAIPPIFFIKEKIQQNNKKAASQEG